MGNTPTEKLTLVVIIALIWTMAITTWWATLWHADTFIEFGGDLPSWSILVIESAKLGVPFVVAGLFTLVIVYTTFRHSQHAILVSCSMLCIATLFSIMVMIGLTTPLVKLCGEFVPGWPSTFETNTNNNQAPNTVTTTATKGCGG